MSGVDDRLREELGALLDGELAPGPAAELRARIEYDDELRREYRELERAVAALRALPPERAPAALREGVRRGLEARDGDASGRAPRGRRPVLSPPLWAAAAALLLAAGAVFWWTGREPERENRLSAQRENRLSAERAGQLREERSPAPEPGRAADADEAEGAKTRTAEDRATGGADEAGGAAEVANGAREADRLRKRKLGGGRADGSAPAAGAKEKAAKKGREKGGVPAVVREAERAGRVEPKTLRTYLKAVRDLPADRLRAHLRAVAGVDDADATKDTKDTKDTKAATAARTAPAPRATVRAREDALLVRAILWRGYVGDEPAPAPDVPSGRRHVDLALRLTGEERAAVVGWLEHLPAPEDARPSPKARAGGPRREARKQARDSARSGRQAVAVRLAWTE